MATARKRWSDWALISRDGAADQVIAAYCAVAPLLEDKRVPATIHVKLYACTTALLLAAMHLNVAGAGIQLDRPTPSQIKRTPASGTGERSTRQGE